MERIKWEDAYEAENSIDDNIFSYYHYAGDPYPSDLWSCKDSHAPEFSQSLRSGAREFDTVVKSR